MTAEDDREPTSADPNERRDAAVRYAWRNASRETSPPDVDARILAAARAAAMAEGKRAETPRRRTRWNAVQRWQPLLAAAAVAGLAFVLVPMTLSPPAERTTAPVTTEAVDSADRAKASDVLPPASSGAGDEARGSQVAESERPAREAPSERAIAPGNAPSTLLDVPASRPAAVPPPPPARETTSERLPPSERARTEASASGTADTRVFGELGSAAAPVPQAREKHAEDAATLDAVAWAERIEALYRAGDLDAAARNLRAFRAVDPEADGSLPDELREWARTVE